MRTSRGYTFVEIAITLAIVATLSGIGYVLYTEHLERTRIARACAEILSISQACVQYYNDHLQYPETLSDVGCESIRDPWGRPYQYLNIQTAKGKGSMRKDRFLVPINTDFDLYSVGADGDSSAPLTAKNSRDDIIRANNGAYIGFAAGY